IVASYLSSLTSSPMCTFSRLVAIHFFFADTATADIYTLSLHDALPILPVLRRARPARDGGDRPHGASRGRRRRRSGRGALGPRRDRKSTRLNSSHVKISYAVFCLKKKKNNESNTNRHIIDMFRDRLWYV